MSGVLESEPNHEDTKPLGQQVADLFSDARRYWSVGNHRFPESVQERRLQDISKTLGTFSTELLERLVGGWDISGYEEAGKSSLKMQVDVWADDEVNRRLHSLAYEVYTDRQNQLVNELLAGKKVTAIAREHSPQSTIRRSDGLVRIEGGEPREISGLFFASDISEGTIALHADEPSPDLKYWVVRLLGLSDRGVPFQPADIHVEEM